MEPATEVGIRNAIRHRAAIKVKSVLGSTNFEPSVRIVE